MNTINKLKKDICYCLKSEKDIKIQECNAPNCKRFTSCMQKCNRELN